MKSRKRVILAFIALFCGLTYIVHSSATTQSTKRRNIRGRNATTVSVQVTNPTDTLTDLDSISAIARLYGFQKTVASRVESVMISNLSETHTIVAVVVDIDYRTPAGEQLNRRTVTFHATVPPGETRHTSVPSWDRQQLFYFVETPPARPSQRTSPFNVSITPKQLVLNRHH